MRRKDRECNDPALFDEVFSRAEVIFLAINGPEYPYCIPVNFARLDSKIYIHSALAGRKLDLLSRNANVGFSAAIDVEIDIQASTTYYKSICGEGLAVIVEDVTEKQQALTLIAERYNARCSRPASIADARRVAIIRIDIKQLYGKGHLARSD